MTNSAALVRSTIEAVVSAHAKCCGVSADAYLSTSIHHPMAESKYLRTLSCIRMMNLMSASKYDAEATKAINRLRRSVSPAAKTGSAWGLRFAYKNTSKDEPYLITTAQIVTALIEAADLLCQPQEASELARSGLLWLIEGIERRETVFGERRLSVPIYSPGTERVVINAVAAWVEVLQRASDAGIIDGFEDEIGSVADWVDSQWLPGIGWTYGPDSNVVDLLHQTYIIDAMTCVRGKGTQSNRLFEIMTAFRTDRRYLDTSKVYQYSSYSPDANTFRSRRFNIHGDYVQIFSAADARPWSIGGLLGSLADAWSAAGPDDEFWRSALSAANEQAVQLAHSMLNEKFHLRDLTHLSEGLARSLRVTRTFSGATA